MSITISSGGQISIGSTLTGYGVKQAKSGTVVYVTDDGRRLERQAITLPHARYALSCDAPASGNPGYRDFERDFLAAFAEATR